MIDIGFIFPSNDYLHDPFRGDPHTHFQILTVIEDNLPNEVNCKIIDLRGIDKRFATYHIPYCDIYLYSVYTLDFLEQKQIVENIRKHYPNAIHVAGGPHVLTFMDDTKNIFDSVIIGNGEYIIVDLIKDFIKDKYKKEYVQNENININDFSIPRRNFLPRSAITRYNMINSKRNPSLDELPTVTAIFSRGCNGNCYFCAMPNIRKYSKTLQYRTPKLIKDEIEYLKQDFNAKAIVLVDELSIPPSNLWKEHLEAIGSCNIIWKGQCRVDMINQDIAKLAYQSGCRALGLGIESVNQKSLDIINKGITVEQSRQTIKILHDNNIESRLYMILGLPGEDKNIVERTWDFITEVDPDLVILSLFTPRPGTKVFTHSKDFGIKSIDCSWDKTMHMYGRYEEEEINLTFEYSKITPWGKSLTQQQIIENYKTLQDMIRGSKYGRQ